MELSERQVQIAELVRVSEFLGVEELAARFNVTTQTIRRDLNALCDHGLARRRHGGVERLADGGNLAYPSRRILNIGAKLAIAREVANHVPNRASLAFSIGTTPEVVAQALGGHDGLRIFTNNLNVAVTACANPTFDVHIAGGHLRNGDRDVLGAGTEAFFAGYKVDIGVYGVGGVEEDGTLLDFYPEEVRARQAIRDNSRASFLVLDHTKFGRGAHVRGGHIGDATKVFCDRRPPDDIVALLRRGGAELIVCEG
ncbi:MAG: DeoR/GlpR transcriptional regulator [Hyphomicrobiales bacterium]|nr:DeoR/GlpR transcriptional regulator [Hyphomicrobiales bacterium]MCP5372551.1 DeoR/GlpR transcriptional regulator [Hyphomicrobiales bacterium]